MPEDHSENLIPQSERTKEEQREIARLGGIASGEARREKAKMSRILQEWLESEHQVVMSDGQKRNLSAKDLLNRTIAKVMSRGDSASVSMIKTIGELLEGSKIQHTGEDGNPLQVQIIIEKHGNEDKIS